MSDSDGGPELTTALLTLREVLPTFERFTREVDGRFAALGQVTEAIASASRVVAESADAFATAVRDKEGVVLAYQFFKKARDVVEANLEQIRLTVLELLQIEHLLGDSQGEEEDFADQLKVFRYLGLAMRIESARLGDEDGAAIATVVSTLGQLHDDIRALVMSQFVDLRAVRETVVGFESYLETEQTAGRQRIEQFRDTIDETFAALDAAFDRAATYAAERANQRTRLQSSFQKIVVALQSQDIVRQKLESVAVGLRKMLDEAVSEAHRPLLNALAEVELGQLSDAEREIRDAEVRVQENVDDFLATCEAALTANTSAKADVRDSLARSNTVARLLAALDELDAVVTTTSGIATEMRQVIQEVRAQVVRHASTLTQMLGRLRLIALNAQVRTAQVSSRSALEVLAARTKDTSEEMHGSSSNLLSFVRDLTGRLERIEEALLDISALSTRERESLRAEGERVELGVRKAEASLNETCDALGDELGRLRRDVTQARLELSRKADLSDGFDVVRNVCAELARATAQAADDAEPSVYLNRRLAELRHGYVMLEQRVVHDREVSALTEHDVQPPDVTADTRQGASVDSGRPSTGAHVTRADDEPPVGITSKPSGGGEFGDNIELF